MKIKTVRLDKVNIGDTKTAKNGNKYNLVGLNISGNWYNNIIFSDEQIDKLKEGEQVELCLYEEEYKGKMYPKFKFPTRNDMLERRIDKLENFAKLVFKQKPEWFK